MGVFFLSSEGNVSTSLEPLDTSEVLSSTSNHFALVNGCSLSLFKVNMAKAIGHLYIDVIFTLVTFMINFWAGKIILRKERTIIHCLIIFDCLVNVLSSFYTLFYQSPWVILG